MTFSLTTLRGSLLGLLVLTTFALHAQVKGVSYTLAPSANYTWFDNNSGLGDGLMVGARVGFGFGQNVELRGIYSQSIDLQNDLENLGLDDDIDPADFTFRDVDITRYGGELKLNLGQSNFFPHLLLGTGIQNIELDGGNENSNIFASAGLGLTLSAADRFTFNIEGKNLLYNFNAVRDLITTDDQGTFGVDINETAAERLNNWSVGANIAFYLGGTDPNELTEVDLAYRDAFSDGLSGLSLIIEPTLSRINWDDGETLSDLRLSDGTRLPLQEGAGRSVYNVAGPNGTVVNGSLANLWSNRINDAEDWSILHGGRIGSAGEFVPAAAGTQLAADGQPLTLAPGKLGNPHSRIDFNPYGDPVLTAINAESAYAQSNVRRTVAPGDTKFRRTAVDGDDRMIAFAEPLTGQDLTQTEEYVQ